MPALPVRGQTLGRRVPMGDLPEGFLASRSGIKDLRHYRLVVQHFQGAFLEGFPVAARAVIDHVQASGLAVLTQRRDYKIIKTFYAWLQQRGLSVPQLPYHGFGRKRDRRRRRRARA